MEKSKIVVRRYKTLFGWEERAYVDADVCDEENMRILKKWDDAEKQAIGSKKRRERKEKMSAFWRSVREFFVKEHE